MSEVDLQRPLELYDEFRAIQERLADLPGEVGKTAIDGAFEVVVDAVINTEGCYDYLEDIFSTHEDVLGRLAETRTSMVELGLSTEEIDSRYEAEIERRQSSPELGLAIAVVKSGEIPVAQTTEVENVPVPTETIDDVESKIVDSKTDTVDPDKKEGEGRKSVDMFVEFAVDKPAELVLGSKRHGNRTKLSRYWRSQGATSYEVESLAVAKVLAERQGEELTPAEIKEFAKEFLSDERSKKLDNEGAIPAIMRSLSEVTYLHQNVFVDNGRASKGRKYFVNPDLSRDIEVKVDAETIAELSIMRDLSQAALEDAKPEVEDSIDDNQESLPLTEIHEALPEIDEFRAFMGLLDVQSLAKDALEVVTDPSERAMLDKFFTERDQWIEGLNSIASSDIACINPEQLQTLRQKSIEKIFNLINSPELIEEVKTSLYAAEEEGLDAHTVLTLIEIIEELSSFSDYEIKLLNSLIRARISSENRFDMGGWSAGMHYIGTVSRVDFEEGLTEDDVEPEKLAQTDNDGKGENIVDSGSDEDHSGELSPSTDTETSESEVDPFKELRESIKEKIDEFIEKGLIGNGHLSSPTSTIEAGLAKTILGSRITGTSESIDRAVENGIIKRGKVSRSLTTRTKLTAADLVAIALQNTHRKTIGNKGSKRTQREASKLIKEMVAEAFDSLK